MEKAYSTQAAARIFGVQDETLRTWIKKGKINAVKLPGGKAWRVPESEIKRILFEPQTKSGEGQK